MQLDVAIDDTMNAVPQEELLTSLEGKLYVSYLVSVNVSSHYTQTSSSGCCTLTVVHVMYDFPDPMRTR